MKMTKKEFVKFAKDRGYSCGYSGRLRKFFILKIPFIKMDIHKLINEKL